MNEDYEYANGGIIVRACLLVVRTLRMDRDQYSVCCVEAELLNCSTRHLIDYAE